MDSLLWSWSFWISWEKGMRHVCGVISILNHLHCVRHALRVFVSIVIELLWKENFNFIWNCTFQLLGNTSFGFSNWKAQYNVPPKKNDVSVVCELCKKNIGPYISSSAVTVTLGILYTKRYIHVKLTQSQNVFLFNLFCLFSVREKVF